MATLSSLLKSNFRGDPGTIAIANTVIVNPNVDPSVADLTSGDSGLFTAQFSLPRAPDVTLGTVSLGSNTTNASITNSGSNGDAVFNFTIPRGPSLSLGTVSLGSNTTNASITNSGTNGDSVFNFTIPRAANVSIGTVSTGAAGSSASITNSGTNGDVVLNFTIPRGDTGQGDVDGPASATDNAIVRFDGTTGKLVQNSSVTISDAGVISGNGSGLSNVNAATLDSLDSTQFLRSDQADVATGAIRFQGNLHIGADEDIYLYESSAGVFTIRSGASGSYQYTSFGTGNSITVGGQTVWHAGNDGSGSGLDADTLDGLQPSVSAVGDTIVQRHPSGYIYANYFNTNPNDVTSGVTKVLVETSNDGFMRHGTQAAIRTFIGAGSGNGLDADLLDGQQGSYYLDYNNFTNTPSGGVSTGKAIAMAIVFG